MSYILDALKKSEQERNRGRAPDLRALHEAPLAGPTEKSRWPYLAAAAIIFIGMALAVWIQPWESKAPPAITITAPHVQVPRPVVAPPSTAPMATASQVVPANTAAQVVPPASPTPQTAQVPEVKIIAFSELPPEVRRGMPEMTIAVHLYSPKPAERMVSINGKMMQEGQEISPGLKLLEIAQDGMVFSYQGYRFKRGVFP